MTHRSLLLAPVAALILAIGQPALATVHVVDQVNRTFVPDDITIHLGDTVEWHWSSAIHTVTNGTGSGDPAAGTLLDDSLTVSHPIVTYTFLNPGDLPFPYFCRLHEAFGMVGIVRLDPNLSGTADDGDLPGTPQIRGVYPNPFNPRTNIDFALPRAGVMDLRVYDPAGHLVQTLLQGVMPGGDHTVTWDGTDASGRVMAAGVYFVELRTPDVRRVQKVMLAK